MGSQLNVRDVPESVLQWIESQRHEMRQTKQEFVLSLLRGAVEGRVAAPLFENLPMYRPENREFVPFTYIDLFAGIGGFRVALDKLGGTCLFTSEWDRNSQKTYKAWYGDVPEGDITKVKSSDIPDHDILAAGFPCQPFSIAGVSKKNSLGHAHGFKDATQGTLFFTLATIVEEKRPPVLLLENVKNLLSHDKGKTWKVIESTLTDLNYRVFFKVVNAADYVPQHRQRIFIVGFDKKVFGDNPPFEFPVPPAGPKPRFRDILDPKPPAKYTLTDHLWKYLQQYAVRHKAKGNGFGFGMTDLDGVSRTLSARYYKDGSEVLIPQGSGKNPRRLTPDECKRLMGFPEHLKVVVSDTQAYRQFGNAVCPKAVEAVGREILKTVCWQLMQDGTRCLLKGRRRA